MEIEPCNHRLVREYAEFVWDELGDFEKAEEVYEQALQECSVDANLVGGFANFPWNMEKNEIFFMKIATVNPMSVFDFVP